MVDKADVYIYGGLLLCAFIIFFFFGGPTMLGFGIYGVTIHNTNTSDFYTLSDAMIKWQLTEKNNFEVQSFEVVPNRDDTNSTELKKNTNREDVEKFPQLGQHGYPVYTEVKFSSEIQFPTGWSSPFQEKLGNRDEEFSFSLNGESYTYSLPYAFKQTLKLNKEECENVKGFYNSEKKECMSYWYLNEICVVVVKGENGYQIAKYSSGGCFYTREYSIPIPGTEHNHIKFPGNYSYIDVSNRNYPDKHTFNSMTFTVRSEHDPFIRAYNITNGKMNVHDFRHYSIIWGILLLVFGAIQTFICFSCCCIFGVLAVIGFLHKEPK